ncbi:MAG: hypothetical protein LBU77_00655 [Clostridiales bacterium]|jgi:hypothetical protein|nr:hypothetical protein [Clostridiales bacterium]
MKRLTAALICICIFLTACAKDNADVPTEDTATATAAVTEAAVGPATSWVDVYTAILNGDNELGIDFYTYDERVDGPESRLYGGCGLYDLDKNEIPELYVRIDGWETTFYHVFTCKDNKSVYLGQIYGNYVEKSTGIPFNTLEESGYTPEIAYAYTTDGLIEIPNYVKTTFSEPIDGEYTVEVTLGDKTYAAPYITPPDPGIDTVAIYDDLTTAVASQK